MRHLIVLTTLLIVLTGCVTRRPPVPREDAELAVWGLVLPDVLLANRYVLDSRTVGIGSEEVGALLPRLRERAGNRSAREALADFENVNAVAGTVRRSPHAMPLAEADPSSLRSRFPEAWALVRVSRVGFDRNQSAAVFFASIHGRDGSKTSQLIVARRNRDGWSVEATY